VGERRQLVAHEIRMVIPWRRLLWWSLLHLGLQISHSGSHVGQDLRLCGKELLHPCWLLQWRLVLVLVVLVLHVVGVGVAASSLTLYWRLINSGSGPGVHHLIG